MKVFNLLLNLVQGIKNALQESKDYTDARGDYIVEQGTSGIWHYEKRASGIAECWGKTTITATSWNTWGSVYEGNPYLSNLEFPTDLFIDTPIVNCVVAQNGLTGGSMYEMGTINQTRIHYIVPIRPIATSSSIPYWYLINAKGLWKTFEQVGG